MSFPEQIRKYMNPTTLLWSEIFEKVSIDNFYMGIHYFHAMIGAMLTKPERDPISNKPFESDHPDYRPPLKVRIGTTDIDLRVHSIIIQASGTGKSVGNSAIHNVAKKLGIEVHTPNSISDASITGSAEEGSWIESADIAILDEASVLFTKNQTKWAKDLLLHFNTIMNPIGSNHITTYRQTSRYTMRPHVTLVLTSFETEEMYKVASKTGFFQRCFFYRRSFNRAERIELRLRMGEVFSMSNKSRDNWETKILKLTTILHEINVWRTVNLPDNVFPMTGKNREWQIKNYKKWCKHIKEITASISETVDSVVSSFLNRIWQNVIRISVQNAICNKRKQLRQNDFKYAANIMLHSIQNVLDWIENSETAEVEKIKDIKKDNRLKLNFRKAFMDCLDEPEFVQLIKSKKYVSLQALQNRYAHYANVNISTVKSHHWKQIRPSCFVEQVGLFHYVLIPT